MNLKQAIGGFERHLEANGYSWHTRRAYRCDLEGLLSFFEGKNPGVRKISARHIADFLNSRHALLGPTGHRRAPGAINRVRASLRSFFGWLCDTGQMGANPAAALRPRPPYPEVPRILSKTEESRLLITLRNARDPLGLRDRIMVEMLLATGMRISELVGLNCGDVDLHTSTAIIKSKGGPVQMRHIRQGVLRHLARYIRWRQGLPQASAALLTGSNGRRITARHFSRRLKSWLRQAGIEDKISPHTFRHTLASRLLTLTGNLRLVQQALGHKSISSTVRYTQVPTEALKAALEAV